MRGKLKLQLFSLKDTLECGQFFRFTKDRDSYLVQTSGRIFWLRQERDLLIYDGVDESFLIHFFRLEEDVAAMLREVDRDPFIHQAIQKYPGMRLIRQDPWECLVSFLLSSAKNISHLRCLIESLCRSFGERLAWGYYIGYTFPEPHCLQKLHPLEEVRAGFRSSYLVQAGQCIDRDRLLTLKELSYSEARERLMAITGVGKKIADCVLLYSLDFLQAFPIDTWMKKGLQKTYFKGKRVGLKEMETFAGNHFGPFAGYAQLYLYHYWRNHKAALLDEI